VKPVIIAVVVQALWGLGRTAVKSRGLALLAILCALLNAAGVDELLLLLGAGLAAALGHRFRRGTSPTAFVPPLSAFGLAAAATAQPFHLSTLFLSFLKVGSVLFGSGYVLLALLRAELVTRLGWLSEKQLLDAVAVGQITPGPLFTTATFVGYVVAGHAGAAVATAGIFLPAFVFVALSGPLVPRLRRSPTMGAFLDGVNVASLALMAVVTGHMARAALVDVWTVGFAVASAILLFRFRVPSLWLILAGAALGLGFAR
jgi:chromate transporter